MVTISASSRSGSRALLQAIFVRMRSFMRMATLPELEPDQVPVNRSIHLLTPNDCYACSRLHPLHAAHQPDEVLTSLRRASDPFRGHCGAGIICNTSSVGLEVAGSKNRDSGAKQHLDHPSGRNNRQHPASHEIGTTYWQLREFDHTSAIPPSRVCNRAQLNFRSTVAGYPLATARESSIHHRRRVQSQCHQEAGDRTALFLVIAPSRQSHGMSSVPG